MVIDGNVPNLVHEKIILKVGISKVLRFKQLYENEEEKDDKLVEIITGEEVCSHDEKIVSR